MNRVTDPADPNRCQGAAQEGQCWNVAEIGCEYCVVHGGKSTQNAEEVKSYILAKIDYNRRIAEMAEDLNPIRELNESLASLRELRTTILARCETADDLLLKSPQLQDLVLRTDKVAKTLAVLRLQMHEALNKAAVQNLGREIVVILVDELSQVPDYELIVDRVVERLVPAIAHAKNANE